MHSMIEKGIRGGVSSVMGDRYVKANNKYVNPKCDYYKILDTYEKDKILEQMKLPVEQRDFRQQLKINYLLYVDANNLYGYAMSQQMPCRSFKWMEPTKENVEMILKTAKDSSEGYILEVDLEYTDKERTKKFPLAPENSIPLLEDLSDYQKELNGNKASKINKLMCTVKDKNSYVIHYSNLQFYLNHGMSLKKSTECPTGVHRIISFVQESWLKVYIELNTKKRTKALTNFEKDIYKLLNNAFFGKTMENVRKRVNIELVTSDVQLKKMASKPTFKAVKKFTENFVAVHKHRTQVKLDKPIYLGFCILELSKLLMYETFYNVFQPKFNDLSLLYMDTDSFVFNIYTKDVYEDLKELSHIMDFSEYPTDHPLYDVTNKKIVGKMKDELSGDIMTEFIAIRSKCYAYKTQNGNNTKKCKGVQKLSVPNIDKYKKCLFEKETFNVENTTMRNFNHEMYIQKTNKLALNPYDDKRYICADGIKTLPLGYPIEVIS